jgi:hypothetical protein
VVGTSNNDKSFASLVMENELNKTFVNCVTDFSALKAVPQVIISRPVAFVSCEDPLFDHWCLSMREGKKKQRKCENAKEMYLGLGLLRKSRETAKTNEAERIKKFFP